MTQLRDGSCTGDPRLDRIRHVDLRSLNWPVHAILSDSAYFPRSYTWRVPVWLNQRNEGACVGFGFAHEAAARPVSVRGMSDEYARQHIYWEAQRIDEWDGGAYPKARPFYEGTSVLAGAKVYKKAGFCDEYRWCLEPADLLATVGTTGPVVIGVDWYAGMMDVDGDGFIHATGSVVGGHCTLVNASRIVRNTSGRIDWTRSYVTIHNSWGSDWGVSGKARLYLADLLKLWPGGDFCVPVGRNRVEVG